MEVCVHSTYVFMVWYYINEAQGLPYFSRVYGNHMNMLLVSGIPLPTTMVPRRDRFIHWMSSYEHKCTIKQVTACQSSGNFSDMDVWRVV
jgi:hypothetical protein